MKTGINLALSQLTLNQFDYEAKPIAPADPPAAWFCLLFGALCSGQ